MSKHTPGPWFAVADKGQTIIRTSRSSAAFSPLAIVKGDKRDTLKDQEANARLIAAAPDLLEAAQLALQIAESWIHDQLDGTSSIDGALLHLDPVRAAIARARGEA